MEKSLLDVMTTRCSAAPQILIADDQTDVVEALRMLLKGEGYEIETAKSPAAILRALETREFDLLLMDLNYTRDTTSGREGLDLLARIQALDSSLAIVAMTAWGSVELAVEAMRHGVGDFVLKPWDNTRLLAIVREQIREGQQRRQAARLGERELQEAAEIQHGFLPKEIPQLPGYEIAGAYQPARFVGGDYFDVYALGKDKLALCIADVVGKGMPAALLMSNLQAAVKGVVAEGVAPQELCTRVNRIICSNVAEGKFITIFYCLLDAAGKRLAFTNAGHSAPILLRRDGSHLRLREGGAPLGLFPDADYAQGEAQFATGDRFLLFTDGVTEVSNAEGEEFGEERLIEVLTENSTLGARELGKRILDTVAGFGGGDFEDDATLVVVSVM